MYDYKVQLLVSQSAIKGKQLYDVHPCKPDYKIWYYTTYLVDQAIIDDRTTYALEQLKQGLNFTNADCM